MDEIQQVPEVTSVQSVPYNINDKIIVHVDVGNSPPNQVVQICTNVRDSLKLSFPNNDVLVFPKSVSITVMSPDVVTFDE